MHPCRLSEILITKCKIFLNRIYAKLQTKNNIKCIMKFISDASTFDYFIPLIYVCENHWKSNAIYTMDRFGLASRLISEELHGVGGITIAN